MNNSELNIHKSLVDSVDQEEEKVGHGEHHIEAGDILKSLVYGGLDGSINTLIIILTGIATEESPHKVLAFCVAAIVGGAIGMGLGDYLSARAEIQYIKSEQAREMYEVENLIEEQKKEVIDIYLEKGFTMDDSARVADLISTNKQAFVNIMMLEELGMVVVNDVVAMKCGVVTFVSFIVLGTLPVIPYIISYGIIGSDSHQLIPVVCIGVIELFSLGFAKAAIIGLNPIKSGMETLILGSAITGVGYLLGLAF